MTTVDVLRAARKLIEDPKDWWRSGDLDNGGRCAVLAAVDAADRRAIDYQPATDVLARLVGGKRFGDVYRFNDSHTHAEVLALFDAAIANEQAKAEEFTASPVAGIPDVLPVA